MDNNLNNDDFNMQPNNNLNLNNQNNDTNTLDNYNKQILVKDVDLTQNSPTQSEEVDTIFSEEPQQTQDEISTQNPQMQMLEQVQTSTIEDEPSQPVEKKKGKGLGIIIGLLIIIISGIIGYIIYDKFFSNITPKQSQTTQKEDKKETADTVKTKDDFYIRLDPTKEIDIYNRVVGKFKIDRKYNDVKITKNEEDGTYTLTVGEKKILTANPAESGLPDFIALMDEKYVAAFFQGTSKNEILLYDLEGNKIETLGNSFGEINKIDNINDVIDKLIVDDKNLTYYECKFNNGVDTETLTKYNVTFEKGKYTKEISSIKQNVTCLIGG